MLLASVVAESVSGLSAGAGVLSAAGVFVGVVVSASAVSFFFNLSWSTSTPLSFAVANFPANSLSKFARLPEEASFGNSDKP